MGKSEKRKNKSMSQVKANPASKADNEMPQVSGSLVAENLHDYAKTDMDSDKFMLCEEEFPALLDSPCKCPAAKQRKTERSDVAILSEIGALSQLINTRSDSL